MVSLTVHEVRRFAKQAIGTTQQEATPTQFALENLLVDFGLQIMRAAEQKTVPEQVQS